MTALKAGGGAAAVPSLWQQQQTGIIAEQAGTNQGCLWLTETDAELSQTV